MPQETFDIFVHVGAGANADPEELDDLASQLSNEINQLDTISAELVQGNELPNGAKGTAIDIGNILIKIAEYGGIAGLATILGSWLSRDERRTITLQIGENKLELTGITQTEQASLIQWFKSQTGLRLDA